MSECINQHTCSVSLSAPHHCICLFCMRGLSIYACCVEDTESYGIWRRVTWCFLAFRGNAVLASTFEGSNKGSPFLRNVFKHSVTSQKHWIRVLYYLLLMWTVWDMKPRNTRRFWFRSTKSINLWLIITCILFLQGYSESSLPWKRHGYAVQIACIRLVSRSVGPPVQSVTQTRVHMAVGRMQSHVMNVQALFFIQQVRKRLQGFALLAYSPCYFPCYSRMFSVRSKCGHHFLPVFFWGWSLSQIVRCISGLFGGVLLSREHWDALADVDVSYFLYFCLKCRDITCPLLIS
jgi:hypothetical protein